MPEGELCHSSWKHCHYVHTTTRISCLHVHTVGSVCYAEILTSQNVLLFCRKYHEAAAQSIFRFKHFFLETCEVRTWCWGPGVGTGLFCVKEAADISSGFCAQTHSSAPAPDWHFLSSSHGAPSFTQLAENSLAELGVRSSHIRTALGRWPRPALAFECELFAKI